MSEWISVDDKYKPHHGLYLTYKPKARLGDRVATIYYDPYHNGWGGKFEVTHWMPLPEPPK